MNATSRNHRPARSAAITTGRRATPQRTARFLSERSGLALLTAAVGATATAGTLIVAAAVRVTIAAPVRERLGYTFRGLPARPDVAVGIFAHNSRVIIGVFGLLLVAQIAAREAGGPGRPQRVMVTVGEVIIAGVVCANVLFVGAALGAYGPRMVGAVLPHGPIELTAYSLALGLYFQGRRRALPAAAMARGAALSVALLAVAAFLETFVTV